MKLLFCPSCKDIFRLINEMRFCRCGCICGKYIDDLYAEYYGDAIPIGFNNSSLVAAIHNQPEGEWGEPFEAFVVPKKCDTFKKRKGKNV